MSEALARGFSRYQFYQLRDEGLIEPVSRGLYRLADLPPIENPDLVAAATRFPSAVLCLISALDWHGITTQIPHQVHLAVARDARLPVLDYPPVAGYRFSGLAFSAGIEQVDVDGIDSLSPLHGIHYTLVVFKEVGSSGFLAAESVLIFGEKFQPFCVPL